MWFFECYEGGVGVNIILIIVCLSGCVDYVVLCVVFEVLVVDYVLLCMVFFEEDGCFW